MIDCAREMPVSVGPDIVSRELAPYKQHTTPNAARLTVLLTKHRQSKKKARNEKKNHDDLRLVYSTVLKNFSVMSHSSEQ